MAGETAELAEFINRFRINDLAPANLLVAKEHILDTLGALIFGSRLSVIRQVIEAYLSLHQGPEESAVVGFSRKAPLLIAIAANSAVSHCAEIDDIHNRSAVCIGGIVLPPILAICERDDHSGEEVIEAVVVGYEIAARVGESIRSPYLFAQGWWPSAVCGAFGAAAGTAKLLGLTHDGVRDALGMAGMFAGGLLAAGQNEPLGRHILYGSTAQKGAVAALLARQGITGPREIFEGRGGFCRAFATAPDFDVLVPRKGEEPRICQTSIKPYGCGRQTHAAVSGLIKVMAERGLSHRDIEEIVVSLPEQASFFDRPVPPTTRMQGLGSAQFTLGLAAVEGTIRPLDFETKLSDPEVIEMMGRIRFQTDRRLSQMYPDTWPAVLRVHLTSGEWITKEVLVAPGDPADPVTGSKLLEKFESLVVPIIGEQLAREIERIVMGLDTALSPGKLIDLLGEVQRKKRGGVA